MREIKFRAWDTIKKKMRTMGFPMYVTLGGDIFFLTSQQGDGELATRFIDKDKFILMQFTGLLDKNGKEIYEGDIVKYDKASEAGFKNLKINIVIWEKDKFTLSKFSAEGYFWEQMKIIGNIYENKELLKDKK